METFGWICASLIALAFLAVAVMLVIEYIAFFRGSMRYRRYLNKHFGKNIPFRKLWLDALKNLGQTSTVIISGGLRIPLDGRQKVHRSPYPF